MCRRFDFDNMSILLFQMHYVYERLHGCTSLNIGLYMAMKAGSVDISPVIQLYYGEIYRYWCTRYKHGKFGEKDLKGGCSGRSVHTSRINWHFLDLYVVNGTTPTLTSSFSRALLRFISKKSKEILTSQVVTSIYDLL